MDETEQYVKMSHAAFPDPKEMPCPPLYKVEGLIFVDSKGSFWADWHGWFVPLLRQDQLQEMVTITPHDLIRHLDKLSDTQQWLCFLLNRMPRMFVKDATGYGAFDDIRKYSSMEQLWLAYVMLEKYGKIWNSAKEEWEVK